MYSEIGAGNKLPAGLTMNSTGCSAPVHHSALLYTSAQYSKLYLSLFCRTVHNMNNM